jgi:tRNA threonylcarbamoyladenosine biosynthesis protein TsaB
LDDVELFAAANGPGSFTGLRIGLATIKSFAATLRRDCVGVPSLQAVAHASGALENVVTLLPAGRGELFTQMFSVTSDGEVTPIDEPAHLKPADAFNRYSGFKNLTWAGEGALLQAAVLREYAEALGVQFFEDSKRQALPQSQGWTMAAATGNLAASVAAIALRESQKGNTVSAENLSAIYVRPSDAELNQKWPTQSLPST